MKCILPFTLLLLLLSCCTELDPEWGNAEGRKAQWMSSLDDDTPLEHVSLPGAHDAVTAGITAWPQWTRTQDLDIAALWNCGVRVFDLRPAWVDGEMGIYHDKYSAHVTFREVLSVLSQSIARHPGEFAILLIRHEEEADGSSTEWGKAFGEILAAHAGLLASYHPGITVGELRGKILVLSRSRYEGGPIGAYLEGWYSGTDVDRQKAAGIIDGGGTVSPLWVQDYYDPEGGDDKWEAFSNLFDAVAAAGSSRPLAINHASGYLGRLPNYRKNAAAVNPRAADLLRCKNQPTGIVMMDFAGVDTSHGVKVCGRELVEAVIGCNF